MAIKSQIIGTLNTLERERGVLRPTDVVEHASNENSPLHDLFEWNDEKAGHQHRLSQARDLIRSFRVDVTYNDIEISVSAFVHDPEAEHGEQGYRSIRKIKDDDDVARQVIVDEMKRVASAANRAKGIAIALNLEAEIGRIEALALSVRDTAVNRRPDDGPAPSASRKNKSQSKREEARV